MSEEHPDGLEGSWEDAPEASPEEEIAVPGSGPGDVSIVRWLFETIAMIAAAVALALFIQAFLVKTYIVPTGSMLPTIALDDRIICNRLAYRFGEPQVGDIVVLENPHGDIPLVKRVVAVGGQVLEIEDGWVYLDGVRQEEPWVQPRRRGKDSFRDPVVIPSDHVWLMGDNRVGSSDSRVFGTIPADSLFGEVFLTYWPPGSFGLLR